jgi:hypothetical protein
LLGRLRVVGAMALNSVVEAKEREKREKPKERLVFGGFCRVASRTRGPYLGIRARSLRAPLPQVNIVVVVVDGHMADDQVRMSSKVARGTPKWRSS